MTDNNDTKRKPASFLSKAELKKLKKTSGTSTLDSDKVNSALKEYAENANISEQELNRRLREGLAFFWFDYIHNIYNEHHGKVSKTVFFQQFRHSPDNQKMDAVCKAYHSLSRTNEMMDVKNLYQIILTFTNISDIFKSRQDDALGCIELIYSGRDHFISESKINTGYFFIRALMDIRNWLCTIKGRVTVILGILGISLASFMYLKHTEAERARIKLSQIMDYSPDAFIQSIINNDRQAVKLFIKAKPGKDILNKALHVAAKENNIDLTKTLIDAGANINTKIEKFTHSQLNNRKESRTRHYNGLMLNTLPFNNDIYPFLLSKGMDVNIGGGALAHQIKETFNEEQHDKNFLNILELNIDQNSLENGFIKAVKIHKISLMEAAIKKGIDLNNVAFRSLQAGLEGCNKTNKKCLTMTKKLLDMGIKIPTLSDNEKATVINLAMTKSHETFSLLLKDGISANQTCSTCSSSDTEFNPPLLNLLRTHHAYDDKNASFNLLISHPEININTVNKNNENALFLINDIEPAKKLVKSGINISHKNNDKQTALSSILSKKRPSIELVKYLLTLNFNLNNQDKLGRTALHHAKKPAVIKLLIEAGANIDQKNQQQETALIERIKEGNTAAIEMLLSLGAATDIYDTEGNSIMFYAIKTKDRYIIDMIKKHSEK